MTVICFSNKFIHRQSKATGVLPRWRNQSLNSILQVVFTIYSLTDAVKCQCSNVGLQFDPIKQIHNAQFHDCKKKKKSMSSALE